MTSTIKLPSSILAAALLAAALALPHPAWAIFQCEKDGQTAYQDKPCPPGSVSKQLAEPPPVSATEMARAQNNAAQQKKTLAKLEADQAKQAQLDAKLANIQAKQRASTERKCKDLALKQKWAAEDATQARTQGNAKSRDKAQTRAQRATEKYQSECGTR